MGRESSCRYTRPNHRTDTQKPSSIYTPLEAKILQFFENSFLKELLTDNHITDIAFNGEFLSYQHNQKGRMKSEIEITKDEVFDFLRQLANLSEKQFSFQHIY